MSSPIIGAVPMGTGSVDGSKADYESTLATNDDHLDEGESNDDRATVEQDVREANDANDKIDE